MATPTTRMHTQCRVCTGSLKLALDLGDLFVSDFPTPEAIASGTRAPLALCRCDFCGLVQLMHTVDRELLYREYWYRSGVNESMKLALMDVVNGVTSRVVLQEGDWVMDIGANDGTLLSLYREEVAPGVQRTPEVQRIAFDPAKNLSAELRNHCEIIVPDFFPPQQRYTGPQCKAITAVAMFYDLEEPRNFLDAIKRVLAPGGVFVVQVADLPSMLDSNAFDAICHEHLEYYALTDLVSMFSRAGLTVFDVESNGVNGGSIRVYAAHTEEGREIRSVVSKMLELERPYLTMAALLAFGGRVEEIKQVVRKTVEIMRANQSEDGGGPVDLYGASTKANTLLQHFGLDSKLIRRAIDRAPAKHGRVTVGTGIPIVGEEEGRADPAKMWVVGPWHFREGILAREKDYITMGGAILFPLPVPEVVDAEGTWPLLR